LNNKPILSEAGKALGGLITSEDTKQPGELIPDEAMNKLSQPIHGKAMKQSHELISDEAKKEPLLGTKGCNRGIYTTP
jgi:hypothetical protein